MAFLFERRFSKLEYRVLLILSVIILFVQGATLMMDVGLMRKTVIGDSMYPAIQDGDTLIFINSKYKRINRGDIVSIYSDSESHYVKRVVGLPNEQVKIEGVHVFINNVKLEEPYVFYDQWANELIDKDMLKVKNGVWELNYNEFFVIGDNRINSIDSRDFGPITTSEIIQFALKSVSDSKRSKAYGTE